MPAGGADLATRLILYLPYLELLTTRSTGMGLAGLLWDARYYNGAAYGDLEGKLRAARLPEQVREFLMRWADPDEEIHVVGGGATPLR
jgi:hypothetical protein